MYAQNSRRAPRPRRVLIIGPSPDAVGGMSSVIRQQMGLTLLGRYETEILPVTQSTDPRETFVGRSARHFAQLQKVRRTIAELDSPLIHIHTCSGNSFYRSTADLLLAQRLGSRVILHIHGAKFDSFFDRLGLALRRVVAKSLTRADRVIALSRGWRTKLSIMAPGAQIEVIENAVELPPAPATTQSGTECHFLLLARMDEWKGIDDLLAACSLLRQWNVAFRVTMAGPPGTAGDDSQLNAKIRNLKLQDAVRFVGPVQGEAKTELLQATNVYVQPSHHEGLPIAVLEALAYGLPVIATRVGGIPEIFCENRAARLVTPRHPFELAEAMRAVAKDSETRVSMGLAARTLATTRFSMERLEADLMRVYDDVLGTTDSDRHMQELRPRDVTSPVTTSNHSLAMSPGDRQVPPLANQCTGPVLDGTAPCDSST